MKTSKPPDLVIPEGYHWCPGCRAPAPIAAFGRSMDRHGGLTVYCRPCKKAIDADRWRRRVVVPVVAGPETPRPDDATARTCSLCGHRKPIASFVAGRRRCSVCRSVKNAEYKRSPHGKAVRAARDARPEILARRRAKYAAMPYAQRERERERRAIAASTLWRRIKRQRTDSARRARTARTEKGRASALRRVELCEMELKRLQARARP